MTYYNILFYCKQNAVIKGMLCLINIQLMTKSQTQTHSRIQIRHKNRIIKIHCLLHPLSPPQFVVVRPTRPHLVCCSINTLIVSLFIHQFANRYSAENQSLERPNGCFTNPHQQCNSSHSLQDGKVQSFSQVTFFLSTKLVLFFAP